MEQIGRYKVLSELGRGAMGIVYQAQDPTIGRLVAIKTIRLGELTHPEEREQLRSRLFREAQSAGSLSHPGIVTIYDIAEEKDLAYISMEFVEGQTLERILNTGAIADAKYLVSVATQTALALDYAHSKGIVHRDIKPGNIMVNAEGMVKITDFGIARIASSKFTHTGTVMGTPSYMSPEQVRGAAVDGRSDMFSLGVVLYEMLTGQKPFTGESITTIIFKIVSENPIPAKEINPSVGTKMNAVVMRALAKEPAERYQACREFAEAIQAAAAQTANLTPTVRRMASMFAATESSDPALLTVPQQKAAGPAPAVDPSPPARTQQSPPPTPPQAAPPPAAKAPPTPRPPSPADDAPTVLERKLPPLVPPVPAAKAPTPPRAPQPPPPSPVAQPAAPEFEPELPRPAPSTGKPSSKPWLPVAAGVLLAVAAGAWWITRGPGVSEPAPTQTPAPVEKPASAPSPSPPPVSKVEVQPPAAVESAPAAPAPAASKPSTPADASAPPGTTGGAPERVIRASTAEPGAQVIVDGKEELACLTPCSIPVPAGRHSLRFTQAGHYPEIRDVEMRREPVDVAVTLRPVLGTVMIATVPPGASLTIDGKPVAGETPLSIKLPLGKHTITAAKEGHGPAQQTVEIPDDNLIHVRITLP